MTIEIKTDAAGNAVLWSEVGGRAVPLAADHIYVRASDGHVLVAPPGQVLQRLRPHEVAMVEYWLSERAAEIKPNVFAGEPPDG